MACVRAACASSGAGARYFKVDVNILVRNLMLIAVALWMCALGAWKHRILIQRPVCRCSSTACTTRASTGTSQRPSAPERWLAPEPAAKGAADAPSDPNPNPEADKETASAAPTRGGAEMRGTKWTSAVAGEKDGRKAAFLPFSGGPVDCIGQRLAMMEV